MVETTSAVLWSPGMYRGSKTSKFLPTLDHGPLRRRVYDILPKYCPLLNTHCSFVLRCGVFKTQYLPGFYNNMDELRGSWLPHRRRSLPNADPMTFSSFHQDPCVGSYIYPHCTYKWIRWPTVLSTHTG